MLFLNKWLPILFGCHQKKERSFFFCGKQLPLCARCTGELVGILFMPIYIAFFGFPNYLISLVFLLPLIVDGFVQALTKYSSNNPLRFITGLMFGFGLACLFIQSLIATFWWGFNYGRQRMFSK